MNNRDLHELVCSYLENLKKDHKAKIPDKLVLSFYDIARRYARRGNFIGYTYAEDFIQDAVIWGIKYLKNYNPEKTTNAFGYMTKLIENCFKQRITKEKNQTKIVEKIKLLAENECVDVRFRNGKKYYKMKTNENIDVDDEDDLTSPCQKNVYIPILVWESEINILL